MPPPPETGATFAPDARLSAMVKSSTPVIILLSLATLAGAGWSWMEHQELVAAASGRTDIEGRLARAQLQLEDARRQMKQMGADLAALRERLRAAGGAADATAASDQPQRRGNGGFRAVMSSPQFQKLMAIQQKAMLDTSYGALFKILNLTPQQLEQFKGLMVQKQQAVMDAMQAAREQGINPRTDPDEFRQAIADAQASVESQIQTQLGPAGYAAYQQYQQTLPQRNVTTQLQQSLSYTSTPLSDDQANQLIQVLAQTAPAGASNGGGFAGMAPMGFGGGGMGGGATVTDQAITQAQGFLTASQVQALQQIQQQQQARQQMQQLMRAGRQGGGG
jgi:hypothetical protein